MHAMVVSAIVRRLTFYSMGDQQLQSTMDNDVHGSALRHDRVDQR